MISKHCGQRLRRTSSDREGFIQKFVVWQCDECGRRFSQGLRIAKGLESEKDRENLVKIHEIRNSRVHW
jgi:ribosomal protein L37AE/L43A